MRIAHFVHRYPPAPGGAESYFRRLSQYLISRGDKVDVWTTDGLDLTAFWSPRGKRLPAGPSMDGQIQVERFRLWRMFGRRWLLKPISLIPSRPLQCLTLPCNPIAPGMWRASATDSPAYDAVHATALPYAFPILCGLRLARRQKVPFFLTPFLHLNDERTRRNYLSPPLQSLLRAADGVFVQTPTEYDAVAQLGIAEDRIYLQGLGVDVAECTGGNRSRARVQWGVSEDEVVVGHLANNSVEKGSVDLLAAMQRLWNQNRPVTLVCAGPEMPNFTNAVSKPGRLPRLLRLGPISEAEKQDFFAGIDLFALPSRSDSFGLVFLEAWANGKPNIAYRAGAIADLIRDGQDGLLAECGNVEQLSQQIDRLAFDPGFRTKLGKTGQSRLAKEFAWPEKLEIVRAAIRGRSGIGLKSPTPSRSQEPLTCHL